MYIGNRKREVLPSLVSPNSEVDYVVLVDFVLAYLRIRLSAIRTYCLCDGSRDVISTPILWVLLGVYVGVAEVGFCGELFLALETLYLDYLAHSFFSSTSLVLSKRS